MGLLGSKYIGPANNLPDDDWLNVQKKIDLSTLSQQFHAATPTVKVTGKQFIVSCNGNIEYADTMEAAQSAAEKLAHQHQTEAFILKPVSKVAPKRDVVTTPITL